MHQSDLDDLIPDSVPPAVRRAFASLETLYEAEQVERGVDQMAIRMTVALQQLDPVFVTVLHGGLMLTGMLQRRLAFPCQFGYVHVGRYGNETTGGAFNWFSEAVPDLANRTVVFIDDIVDQGQTLVELQKWALERGASTVQAAVLVTREGVPGSTPQPEYSCFRAGPGFLVGCGMDYAGYGRNLATISVIPDPK